ncbi:MAG TPA: rhodanese-like domain-containing protein [Candidatus Ozemobacteraceae bacterium]|nr:rhodanese-like domain-containing protein [Candidatus Ozemobacteraceae bacterium]
MIRRKGIGFARCAVLALLLSIAVLPLFAAGGIKDSESASHADEAAEFTPIATYEGPGFAITQFNLAVLSHYSYLLVSGKEALLVDPGRDIDAYKKAVAAAGVTVKGVFLTHSHADFVAGHMEAAKAFSCPVYASRVGGAAYAHEPLDDSSTLTVGTARLRFLETPGHTPDGICGIVSAADAPDKPLMMFSGDTLFAGSLGRPDLMGGKTSAAALASMMFDTWNGKLAKLPDDLVVLPAHGAGSLCGAHLSDDPSTTIGREKASNAYLKYANNRSAFISAILDGLPDAPAYFKHNAALNHAGPELIDGSAPLPAELAADAALTDPEKHWVVDLRDAAAYAAGHIPNAVNIGLRGRLETWTGIMVPWGADLVLCGSEPEITEAIRRLHRIGYKASYIKWETWANSGQPKNTNLMVKAPELHAAMQAGTAPIIVDVRLPTEWMGMRIGQVLNLPLSNLAELAAVKLNPQEPVVAVCNSAYRSSMAVGVLERIGFTKASSLDGGSEAWQNAGLPMITAEPAGTAHAPAAAEPTVLRDLNLAERLSPAELMRIVKDLPGTVEIVDIRPAPATAEYNPVGARSVDIADLLRSPAYLAGTVPLVIVDRDGSLAMMVAGILQQKTKRPIKALHGGLEAYWAETEIPQPTPPGAALQPAAPRSHPAAGPAVTPAPAASPTPAAPAPAAPKKKKSAGC